MEPGIDILVNCAGGVGATAFIEALKKATRYWWEFTELVENLGGEIELLESVCGSMEVQVINAGANSRVPGEDIVLQLKNAATLLKKAKDQEMKAKASSDCCNGAFPNLICRCIVGRKTEKMTNKMKELKDYLQQKLDFAHRSSLRAMSLPQDFIFFDSIEKARDEIITALKDDTKLKIGLFGMGGCGKSSMLKIVHKEAQDRELFEKIAFVEVSDPPNILDIQQAIASWIDLNFETEMDKHARAARLSMTLEKDKSYLIILDNVWRMLKFDEIGIPSRKNCKVLLSTRHKDKCTLMDCQKVIPVPHLTKDEAWELFQQRAGAITEEVKNQAEEVIADYCRGLPVAIRAVASTLKGKRDYAMMEALTQLKHHTLWDANSEEEYNPYKCLKFSFEELKIEKEKSLYLLCALFPNDAELTLETLIRFAFGLGIFQDVDSYQSARRTIPTVVDKFKDSCLLLQEKGQHIKLHDMFRAVALPEANEKTRVLTEPSQDLKDLDGKQYFKETTRLYYHGTFEFPHRLHSPELEILHMSNDNGYLSKFPDTFFEEIIKLKVLAIKNTSGFTKPALLFPQSFERLKELRTLCLNGWRIDNMSCFEKLKMLHSMELSSCEVKELPEAALKKLKLLQVSCCIIDANPYEVLARCSQLKELYFVKNSVPNMVPNHQNVATFIQQLASYQVLQRYHLEFGSSVDAFNDDSRSKCLSLNDFDISILTKAIQGLAQKPDVLFLEKVRGDCTSIIPGLILSEGEYMDDLTEFTLRDSDSIECLIDAIKHQSTTPVFSKLEKLKVEAMKGMKALCTVRPPRGLLQNLKELFLKHCGVLASLGKLELLKLEVIELEDCPKLTSLFTAATAQKMKMLQVLKVRGCIKLKHILTDEEGCETSNRHVFPELKHVTVKECNNLECIMPVSYAGGLSQLESLEIENAAALTHVFGKPNYEDDQNQQRQINLAALKVFKLIGLRSLIDYCAENYEMKYPSLDKPYMVRCPQPRSVSEPSGAVKATKQDFKINSLARSATWKARFNTLVTDIENEKHNLLAQIKEVEAKSAEPSGDVKQWLEDAEHVIEKVNKLTGKADASKSHSCGIFNWKCQFIEGKRLARMTEKMKGLNKRLASTRPSQTDHKEKSSSVQDTQPIHHHSSGSEDFIFFESTKRANDELLMALKDDGINIIGLYGMAGCGKTSLVMQVCKAVKGLKLFDDVIYVTAPYPNVKPLSQNG